MTKDVMDKYKELEFVVEKLVDYCNNVGIATACELIAVEAALERLYKARQKESEKDMTNVINNGKPAFPEAGARGKASGGEGMSMRDYFAAKAMQVSFYKCEYFPDEHWRMGVALDSYAMADAMLEMREMKK